MICQELFKALLTLLVGLTIAGVGLWIYFRQKEYELVKQRYLEQSIDVLASELESALGTFSHNWARCLQILKEYRDMEEHFEPEQLFSGFLKFESSRFQRIAHHRLRSLIQSDVIWNVCQLALAFATAANAKAASEIPAVIKARLKGQATQAPHAVIVEAGFAEMKKLDEKSHKFAHLLSALQAIAEELEKQRLNFKSLKTFAGRPAIQKAISDLATVFAEELEPYAAKTGPLPRESS